MERPYSLRDFAIDCVLCVACVITLCVAALFAAFL